MCTEFTGRLSLRVHRRLLTGCGKQNSPIEYFGDNCEFLKSHTLNYMTYNNVGGKYVS